MTPAQKNLFWRTWQAAARAHGWGTRAGLALALARRRAGEVWTSPQLNQTLATVYEIAERTAAQERRDLKPDDLRHAVTIFATGRNVSSKRFSNSDFDKVLALLRLLGNPENLDNLAAASDAGGSGERRRLLHVVTRAPTPYWHRLAADKFGHTDLDRLTLAQLRQLALTLRNRRPVAPQPSLEPQPA